MRASALAFLGLLPISAVAQTPQDIAHQLWPEGAPVSQNVAAQHPHDMRGGETAADLARLAAPPATRAADNAPPRDDLAPVAGFTVADLVRLRDGYSPASMLFQSPPAYRTVAR